MSDVEKYADELIQVSITARELVSAISAACGGSFQWGIEEIVKSFKSMFDRFCPYKIGDRIQLLATPKSALDPTSDWYQSRHFLVPGAYGTVMGRGYSGNQFSFDVVFDDESWIDRNGIVTPIEPDRRHTYRIGEESLRAKYSKT